MRKFLILCCVLFPFSAHAQRRTLLNEAEQMGLLSGLAAACDVDAHVMHDYEEIVSRIIANKAPSPAVEDMFLKNYVSSKAKFFLQQKKNPEVGCGEVITNFTQMPIFRFTLFDDGSLITDKGQYLLPRGQKKFNPNAQQVYPAPAGAVRKPAAPRTVGTPATAPAAPQNAVLPYMPPAPMPKPVNYNKSQPVRSRMQPVRNTYD